MYSVLVNIHIEKQAYNYLFKSLLLLLLLCFFI